MTFSDTTTKRFALMIGLPAILIVLATVVTVVYSLGRMAGEVVPVPYRDARGREAVLEKDEHPRADTTLEALARLPPVFRKDGSVHAGNSSAITDGAGRSARITATDVLASNGVIHVIDRVLLPAG